MSGIDLEEMLERAARSGIMVRGFADEGELRAFLGDDLAHLLSERFERATAPMHAPDKASPRQGAVPIPPTPLAGREQEVSEVAAMLGMDHVRMITMTAGGEAVTGTRLLGAAEALREETGTPLAPAERRIYGQRVTEARRRLDGSTFAVEWAHGRAMKLEEAITFALAEDDRATSPAQPT
jgi:hypothetical protein